MKQRIVVKLNTNDDKKTPTAGVESSSVVGPDKNQIAVTAEEKRSWFMRWLSKCFKGGSSNRGQAGGTHHRPPQFIGDENMVLLSPVRSLDNRSRTDKENEELDQAISISLAEGLKKPNATRMVKLSIDDNKKARKALQTAVSVSGAESVSSVGSDRDEIVVTGEGIDAVEPTKLLRKRVGYTELVSVGLAEEKKEESKPTVQSDPYQSDYHSYATRMKTFSEEFQHLRIHLQEIKSATDNFDDKKVIGTGGFGKVYEGELSHFRGRSMAAFKRLDRRFGQGNPEFWKEIMMLSRYSHENLISLLGFCDEDGEKILIYEHASNGSLDRHLGSTTFTWIQRLKVCLNVARGLCYLHDDTGTQQRVLHRDIKSSNILLDEYWNAKVSDMGLSKIGPANQQYTSLFTLAVGTLGYLDPMYMELGILTKESDVYSFGVVLFEVLCGRLCFENSNGRFSSLVRMWKQKYKQKKLDEIIFQALVDEMDPRSLETYSDIAFQCLQKYREGRPTMSLVVEKLETALEFQEIYEEIKHSLFRKISLRLQYIFWRTN